MHRRLLFLLLLAATATIAPASEELPTPDTLTWGSVAGALGYNVYRSELPLSPPADYGICLLGSVQGTSAPVPENPPPGGVYGYLVSSFDANGETDLGMGPGGNPRHPPSPCRPARRFFPRTTNGDAGDGIEDGREPQRNPSAYGWAGGPGGIPRGRGERVMNPKFGAGVYLATGELYAQTREHILLARQVGMAVARTYRSQITYDGPFGFNWDSNVNARAVAQRAGVLILNGATSPMSFTDDGAGGYVSPAGVYSVLRDAPDGALELREPDGRVLRFHGIDGSNLQGALESVADRNRNVIAFLYNQEGLLTTVVDAMGRALSFDYDAAGRIIAITDWAGRAWAYTYDGNGDLVAARSPIVSGTPTGNDFPTGKTTSYQYSAGCPDERLNHNLVSMVAPNDQVLNVASLTNLLDPCSGPGTVHERDRVKTQIVGGTNASGVPAGGQLTYSYLSVNPGADPSDPALPRRLATVVDRNGNQKEYAHNAAGNCLSEIERTNRNVRPGEPDYTTSYQYSPEGEIVEVVLPEGNRMQLVYDRPGLDRYREGNLLEVRSIADPLATGGRGDGHGGEINDVVARMTYDPVFNQLLTRIEPRGNDPAYVPQNGGAPGPARYRTTWTLDYQEGDPAANGINALAAEYGIDLSGLVSGLGDVNGDGRTDQASGNVVRADAPTVTLDPASNQAAIQGDTSQEIATLVRWNDRGQPIATVDAEENLHVFSYFPETDPDGDGVPTPAPPDGRTLDPQAGGYRSSHLLDRISAPGRDNGTNPPPATVLERFRYDAVGNLTHHTDGRGVLTRLLFNQLDQVVELRRAAATADAAGPDGDPATLVGEAGLTPFSYKVRWEYDANDNVTHVLTEDRGGLRGAGDDVEDWLTWDILDARVGLEREVAPGVTLMTGTRYDANGNLIEVIRPEGDSDSALYDERDLPFQATRGAGGPRGGSPSTTTFSYDANGNLLAVLDGRGNPTAVAWDGHDRPARWTDPVGNTLDRFYDPAGNVVREMSRGPIGGPSPANQAGVANTDLADVEYLYDEMGRPFERQQALFVPAGVATMRPPVLVEGSLAPGDGATNRRMEYDRLGRLSFVLEDSGATERFDYDGLGRLARTTAPDGSSAAHAYDDAHNEIESLITDVADGPGLPDEVFLTTWLYDALGRLTAEVDNLGQTSRLDYDSLDAVVATSDANGPPGGTLMRRSPGHTGMVVSVNDHGNVTRFQRDGAGRLRTVERVLTASGLGDGTLSPAPDPSNPHNPDGLLQASYLWDDDSLLAARLDDNGHTTSYTYDNLGRVTQTTADDGTLTVVAYDAEDNPTTVVDPNGSVITNGHDLANRLVGTTVLRGPGVVGTTANAYEYDGLGRLTRSTDNNAPLEPLDDSEVRRFYDSLGRVIEEQQILPAGGAKPVDLAWEAEGRLTDVIYPSNRQLHYGYDAFDRLAAVTDTARPESAMYGYLGMGRVHTRSYGNGVRTTTLDGGGTSDPGFDGVQRLTQLRHLDPANALRAGFEYTYDAAGNRRSVVRPHDLAFTGEPKGELYGLDSGYRLIDFTEAYLDPGLNPIPIPPPDDDKTWVLDGEGSWEEMTWLGTGFQFTPSNMNEYDEDQSGDTRFDDGIPDDAFDPVATPSTPDGLNHGHDKNGNLTDSGRHDLLFDYRDRLVEIREQRTGVPLATYSYDAEDRRVLRDAPGAPVPQANRRYLYFAKVASEGCAPSLVRKRPGRTTYHPVAAGSVQACPGQPVITAGINYDSVIEERDPGDVVQREIAFGNGRPLWQVLADGSSQYLHEDAQGSVVLLTEGAAPAGGPGSPGAVLERVTYDAYGKPTFETATNVPVREPTGEYVSQSQFGNTYLFGSMWYDPDSGARGTTPLTDTGGFFFGRGTWHEGGSNLMDQGGGSRSHYNPDEGRWIGRAESPDAGIGTNGASTALAKGLVPFDKYLGAWTSMNPYGTGGAPSNLGTGPTPMHARAHKPKEIVVVGSKVKDIVREAGLHSDGDVETAALAIPNLLEARKSGNESAAISSLRTLVTAQAMPRGGGSQLFFMGKLKVTGDPMAAMNKPSHPDRLLEEAGLFPSAGSDKRKQSLYFPETMLQDIEGHPDIAGLFKDTAEGETGHAHGHLDYIKKVGDPATGPVHKPFVIHKPIDKAMSLYLCPLDPYLGWGYYPTALSFTGTVFFAAPAGVVTPFSGYFARGEQVWFWDL